MHIYVSPGGNDSGTGTKSNPFKTVNKAKTRVSNYLSGQKGDIYIHIAKGEYKETLEFTVKDSKDKKKYTVPNVSLFLDDTDNYRQEYNKQNPDAPLEQDYYKIKDSSWLLTVIPTVVMLGMGIFLIVFMFRQNGGGRYSAFGKANISAFFHRLDSVGFQNAVDLIDSSFIRFK